MWIGKGKWQIHSRGVGMLYIGKDHMEHITERTISNLKYD
jgi:hypothetical protein